MEHKLIIVVILTIGFVLASLLGYLAQRLKLPSILGYLLAGFVIGPYSPGFVADMAIAEQLAEIGVILMLFGVGMHFKLVDLVNVKNIAIPGATLQIIGATLVSAGIVYFNGWTVISGIIIGLAVAVASTVVLVRVLSENNLLTTQEGHIAIGWLIVEDIFTVLMLVLLPTFAIFMSGSDIPLLSLIAEFMWALAKFFILLVIVFTLGDKVVSYILTGIARLHSHELFTSTVLAVILSIAAGSAIIFGASMALGAFIAGMVIAKTKVKYQAAANALPLKNVFTIIFFLSVGMLFNPWAIVTHFYLFIGILFVILIVKPITAYLVAVILGYPVKIAVTVAFALAQVGEFSFILIEEAMKLHLIPEEGFDLVVACALVSISINTMIFQIIDFIIALFKKFIPSLKNNSNKPFHFTQPMHPAKSIVVGAGSLGRECSDILKSFQIPPILIEQNIDLVSELEDQNYIIFGDASHTDLLQSANIENVDYLVITITDIDKTIEIIHIALQFNPDIKIITIIKYISEIPDLDEFKINFFCLEHETLKTFSNFLRKTLKIKAQV